MQTFLPYPDFRRTAAVLDRQRLGKQRVEAKQILQCLRGEGSPRWANHPAVKMWRGHEGCLAAYGWIICAEWINRGYRDSLQGFFSARISDPLNPPIWLGNPAFHISHQSNLIRKLPAHYAPIFLTSSGASVSAELPYVWPVA